MRRVSYRGGMYVRLGPPSCRSAILSAEPTAEGTAAAAAESERAEPRWVSKETWQLGPRAEGVRP
jgi:hypothetical protein